MKAIEYVAVAFLGEYNGKDTADKLFDAVSKRIDKTEKAAYKAIDEIEAFIESEYRKVSEFELGQCKNLHTRYSDLEWLRLGVLHIKSTLNSKVHYCSLKYIFNCAKLELRITHSFRLGIGEYCAYVESLENHNYLDIMRAMQKEFMEFDAEMETDSLNK